MTIIAEQIIFFDIFNKPLSPDGGVVGLKGNLAPEGAIVKNAGLKKLQFRGVNLINFQ